MVEIIAWCSICNKHWSNPLVTQFHDPTTIHIINLYHFDSLRLRDVYMHRYTIPSLVQIMHVACSVPGHYLDQRWNIGFLGTQFSEILIEFQAFTLKKIHLKTLSAKWRPSCLILNVLRGWYCLTITRSMITQICDHGNQCIMVQLSMFITAGSWNCLIVSKKMVTQFTYYTVITQIAKFMGPTWGPPGSCRPQMGPMLAPWSLLSGNVSVVHKHGMTVRAWQCCIVSHDS